MRDYEGLPGYDAWISREPEYAEEPMQEEEEELPEPTIEEAWNASRGEYETVVTFASGKKFAVRQVPHWDTWEVNGPDFYMDFQTREQALNYLTDDEFARTA
jgi:hypothetical protein